jgi:hypothetical protein
MITQTLAVMGYVFEKDTVESSARTRLRLHLSIACLEVCPHVSREGVSMSLNVARLPQEFTHAQYPTTELTHVLPFKGYAQSQKCTMHTQRGVWTKPPLAQFSRSWFLQKDKFAVDPDLDSASHRKLYQPKPEVR